MLSDCDYVAIFDADFKPEPSFLVSCPCWLAGWLVQSVQYLSRGRCVQMLTVPYLIDNPEVGYVQARWTFANPDESYLTKVSAS